MKRFILWEYGNADGTRFIVMICIGGLNFVFYADIGGFYARLEANNDRLKKSVTFLQQCQCGTKSPRNADGCGCGAETDGLRKHKCAKRSAGKCRTFVIPFQTACVCLCFVFFGVVQRVDAVTAVDISNFAGNARCQIRKQESRGVAHFFGGYVAAERIVRGDVA